MYEYIYGFMLTNTIIIDEGEDRAIMEGRVSTGENIAISGRLHLSDGPPDTRSSSRGRNAILPPVITIFFVLYFSSFQFIIKLILMIGSTCLAAA